MRRVSVGLAAVLTLVGILLLVGRSDTNILPDVAYLWVIVLAMFYLLGWLGDPQFQTQLMIDYSGLRFGKLELIPWEMVESMTLRTRLCSSKRTVRFRLRQSSRRLLGTAVGRRTLLAFDPNNDEVGELLRLAATVAPHILPRGSL